MKKFDREKFVNDLCVLAEMNIPFEHNTCDPKLGMDCVNVVRYAYELQKPLPEHLTREFDAYDAQPNGYYLLKVLRKWVREIPATQARPADLLVFYIRKNPKHMAVLIGEKEVIEAHQSVDGYVRKVLRMPLDPTRPIATAFRIPDFA